MLDVTRLRRSVFEPLRTAVYPALRGLLLLRRLSVYGIHSPGEPFTECRQTSGELKPPCDVRRINFKQLQFVFGAFVMKLVQSWFRLARTTYALRSCGCGRFHSLLRINGLLADWPTLDGSKDRVEFRAATFEFAVSLQFLTRVAVPPELSIRLSKSIMDDVVFRSESNRL
jgi:hypothetical protein